MDETTRTLVAAFAIGTIAYLVTMAIIMVFLSFLTKRR